MIGKVLGKVIDYGINKTQAGKPQAVVQFAYEVDGQQRTISWFGQLTPDGSGARKGIEITLKALAACGLTIENIGRLSTDFVNGPSSGILDTTKDVSLELQEEASQNDAAKMVTKVAWVNDPNDTYVLKKISAAEAVQVMSGIDFTGDFHKIINDKLAKNPGQNANTGGGNQNYNQNNSNQTNMNTNQNNNQNYNNNNGQNSNGNNGGNNQNQNYNQNGNGQNQNYNNNNGNNQNQNNNSNQNNNQNQNGNGQNGNGGNGNFKTPFLLLHGL